MTRKDFELGKIYTTKSGSTFEVVMNTQDRVSFRAIKNKSTRNTHYTNLKKVIMGNSISAQLGFGGEFVKVEDCSKIFDPSIEGYFKEIKPTYNKIGFSGYSSLYKAHKNK